MKVWTQDYMLTLWTAFDLFQIIPSIYSHKWSFDIYYAVKGAHLKTFKPLSSSFGSGDTKYPQKLGKFTTLELLFDLHGCFAYIIMLQIFRGLMGNVSVIYRKLINAVYLGLRGRPIWDIRIYWRCVQFTVKWARSHAFRSTISRSPTSTRATAIILFCSQRYSRNNIFHEEFVNLGAEINILLSKHNISILKNHCLANSSTNM